MMNLNKRISFFNFLNFYSLICLICVIFFLMSHLLSRSLSFVSITQVQVGLLLRLTCMEHNFKSIYHQFLYMPAFQSSLYLLILLSHSISIQKYVYNHQTNIAARHKPQREMCVDRKLKKISTFLSFSICVFGCSKDDLLSFHHHIDKTA